MADTTTRRAVMLGAGGVGLTAVLTACSGYGQPTADQASEPAASSPPATGSDSGAGTGSGDGGAAADALAKTADIPEGGGKVFKAQKVVVTQPKAGEFKCFSSVCTHQGCDVSDVDGGTINCPCHGSKFNIADGSVANGPADKPLEEKTIKVDGESITLA
ncbi:Rieske (2Fe-2S) protein [Planomonospora venezuelensis]|uniref:Cytochrome bc1 complex Rieske iron-sulfur subunit n=1 Tax=Planomonospora venezuelensis TaxID=1999 RepID=A0A841D4Z3_PLAVE|nr:Rieske (2Fe-2S) protein [Planomonospora venezuelensis]MBB5963487.1 Rieske Fe-S protein [Planomonospora venezuelensis]GIM62766.1 iron-sulfur protein [Planomonospora venezuelensis]